MFKAGERIQLRGKTIKIVQAVFVAPTLDINGRLFYADKPISSGDHDFLKKHNLDMRTINEDGDSLLRLTGIGTVNKQEVPTKESSLSTPEHSANALKPRKVPTMGSVASQDKKSDMDRANQKEQSESVGTSETEKKSSLEASRSSETSSSSNKAVNFQRQITFLMQDLRTRTLSGGFFGYVYQHTSKKVSIPFGNDPLFAAPKEDLNLEKKLGADLRADQIIVFNANSIVFTDPGYKVLFKTNHSVALQGALLTEYSIPIDSNSKLQVKLPYPTGYMTEVISDDILIETAKNLTVNNSLLRANKTITLQAEEDLSIALLTLTINPSGAPELADVAWINKPSHPSLRVNFLPSQSTQALSPALTQVSGDSAASQKKDKPKAKK